MKGCDFVPRDSRVEILGRGLDKLTTAMAYGGIGLMRANRKKLRACSSLCVY